MVIGTLGLALPGPVDALVYLVGKLPPGLVVNLLLSQEGAATDGGAVGHRQ